MILMLPEFEIAFNKAEEINSLVEAKRKSSRTFIPLDDIVDAVRHSSGFSHIDVIGYSFKELAKESKNTAIINCGAMLTTNTEPCGQMGVSAKKALIVFNSDNNAEMQRFSIVHELGHLITDVSNFPYETSDDGNCTVSAHINADITYLTDNECKGNDYLIAEQIANIFALLVLIPDKITIQDMVKCDVDATAKKYGVNVEALYSRMFLSQR